MTPPPQPSKQEDTIRVSEIFYTIAGEGPTTGLSTVFVRTGGCDWRCAFCIDPSVPILTADMRWVPAGELLTGTPIIGTSRRKDLEAVGAYRTGIVEGVALRTANKVRVHFEDAPPIDVSESHCFTRQKTHWFIEASRLEPGMKVRYFEPHPTWNESDEYKIGYLAGAADGDGSFHNRTATPNYWHFVIATGDNEILERFESYASDVFSIRMNRGRHHIGGYFSPEVRYIGCLRLTRTSEVLRFREALSQDRESRDFWLGYFAGMVDTDGSCDGKTLSIHQKKPVQRERIARCLSALSLDVEVSDMSFRIRGGRLVSRPLVAEAMPVLERKWGKLWTKDHNRESYATVDRVEPIGYGDVVSIKTDIGTYIANGFLSRNCDSLHAVLPEFRHTWKPMTATEILTEVRSLAGPCLITLSGGNPAIQPMGSLIERGQGLGYTFSCETQGTIAAPWLAKLDHLTISPKPPSSGMQNDYAKLHQTIQAAHTGDTYTDVVLKIPVFDDADYQFARNVAELHPSIPMWLTVGNSQPPGPGPEAVRPEGFEPSLYHGLNRAGEGQGPEGTRVRSGGQGPEGVGSGVDFTALSQRLRWLSERVLEDKWLDVRVGIQMHTLAWQNEQGR